MVIIEDFLIIVLQVFVPIALAALAGTISERGGMINLGLEGMMLMGAFAGAAGSYFFNNPFVGLLLAMFVGAMMGLLHAFFCIKLKAHQSVMGVGINLFASGLTAVLLKMIWNNEGMSVSVKVLPSVTIPILNKIPIIGVLFDNQSIHLYLTIIIGIVAFIIIYKTKIGLRYRGIGDFPKSVETAGINVAKYKYWSVIISGMIAGIAGSYLSISLNDIFVKDMVAGRGFMGMAANIFGGWNPIGSLIASLIFSIAQAFRFYLTDFKIPNQFIEMLPYIVTLIVLVGAKSKSRSPEALGKE
ncbi:ABC transporter permease [Miniphocaeibacter halophilus]|uniref:ABC transporter permease n=1 Tax=Miniphocaeibacter halophilus TaxID=2931922 RepID=A0AC61MSS8_9FIRM|nr:ABC transporter permease [Miniphocaeibacter halophilus]QQK07256.1 ABC transporter permease [Miniphocaeibacter halophilus]